MCAWCIRRATPWTSPPASRLEKWSSSASASRPQRRPRQPRSWRPAAAEWATSPCSPSTRPCRRHFGRCWTSGRRPSPGSCCPGTSSVITGADCFGFLAAEYGVAGVVAGFEPEDILTALLMLARQTGPAVENQYIRAVQPLGNTVAQELMRRVYEPRDADWRGLGVLAGSGLGLRAEFSDHDAALRFPVEAGESSSRPGAAAARSCAASSTRRTAPSSEGAAPRRRPWAPAW